MTIWGQWHILFNFLMLHHWLVSQEDLALSGYQTKIRVQKWWKFYKIFFWSLMIVPNQRENIVTEYAFFKKHFTFWQIFTPKKMMLEALQIHIGNFSKCFIVLYKHLRTLKVKRQISHAYMICEAWCLNSSILLCPLNLDLFINVFFSFIFWS
jgi:hypothetical protein